MRRWLRDHPSLPLRVFVVWEPILPTDWFSPTTGVLARIADRRVAQFWDRGHLIAHALAAGGLPAREPACCRHGGTLWDDLAVFPPGVRFAATPPTWISGPVVDSVPALASHLPTSN